MPSAVDLLRQLMEEQDNDDVRHFDHAADIVLARAVLEIAERLEAFDRSFDKRLDKALTKLYEDMSK